MGHVCNCPGENHPTFGACMRSKNVQVTGCGIAGSDTTTQKRWDSELERYRDARAQGIQPEGTTTKKIQRAVEASDRMGVAYDASAVGQASDPFTQKVVEASA